MEKVWSDIMWEEYQYWFREDRKNLKKINDLIKSIERDGVMQGIGKPEPLRYRNGYSRRIDEKNRLIYDIKNGQLLLISCKGHYEN